MEMKGILALALEQEGAGSEHSKSVSAPKSGSAVTAFHVLI